MFKHIFEWLAQAFGEREAKPPAVEIPDGAELVLYKFDACPYCRRVMRVLKELSLELEYRDTRQNSEHRQELLRIGGKTQVPCLLINGQPLYESADINRALRAYAARLGQQRQVSD